MDAKQLRERAARCRRLAAGSVDNAALPALLELATRYEREADELDRQSMGQQRPGEVQDHPPAQQQQPQADAGDKKE